MMKISGQSVGQRALCWAVPMMVAAVVVVDAQAAAVGRSWGPYRGANTGRGLSEADVRDFAKLGGNLLRLSFPTLPLLKLEPDDVFNEEAFACLKRVLGLGPREEQRGQQRQIEEGVHASFGDSEAVFPKECGQIGAGK